MNDPIKVIWKFKNSVRRIQYHQYIFVGSVPKDIKSILEKIADLNFYDTLTRLSKAEYNKMQTFYGDRWYFKFFNTYHINSTIFVIKESTTQKNELIEKFGQEWFKKHIEGHKLMEKKLIYSYEALIKDERLRKTVKKGRATAIVEDEADMVDYTTNKKIDIKKMYHIKQDEAKRLLSSEGIKIETSELPITTESSITSTSSIESFQIGGDNEDDDDVEKQDEYFEEGIETTELLQDEEVDMEEIEQLYKDADVAPDDDVNKTSALIKKALEDEKLFDKKISQMIDFDKSKDSNIHDESLRDVYKKIYVTHQYIFKDDTIKMVKDKICCAIKNHDKFGKDPYIIPSRQYLWAEYYFGENLEKIMLGQKWMKRNELLTIDIEPNNNFRYYEELIGQLKILRDNIRRYGNKIRREDDESNILFDYENYILNNEVYMMDLYNEFGLNYKPDAEAVRNLQDVYLKLYFPKIRTEDIKYILEYLNNEPKIKEEKLHLYLKR